MRYQTTTTGNAEQRQRRLRLNQLELADRWLLRPRTLEKWRQTDRGPPYLRIGGRIVYRLEDVIAFEAANLRGGR
jgi:hypothetical protein